MFNYAYFGTQICEVQYRAFMQRSADGHRLLAERCSETWYTADWWENVGSPEHFPTGDQDDLQNRPELSPERSCSVDGLADFHAPFVAAVFHITKPNT